MKHGGDLSDAAAVFGGDPGEWLDLSTGINPNPWRFAEPIEASAWTRLPSRMAQLELTAAARRTYGIPDAVEVVPSPGSQALIQWIPRLLVPGTVAVVGPTYSEHASAWLAAGHRVISVNSHREIPDSASHVVVVNPNNPDGRWLRREEIEDLARRIKLRAGWLVVDEAFADLHPGQSASPLCAGWQIVVLRSFGKFYGLAGLRLGFAIAEVGMAGRIAEALGPWAVSGPATVIGRAALADLDWAADARATLSLQAKAVDAVLAARGIDIVGGTNLFRLARHGAAREVHARLARRKVWCRSFDWADDLLRFGIPGDDRARDRLAQALDS
jgi:cobalamin biosynthetic protein CobC